MITKRTTITMAKTKTISPRLHESGEAFYSSTFGSKTAGAEYVLAAFPTLYAKALRTLKGEFSAGELTLIIDCHNGTILTPGMAGQHIGIGVQDSIDLDETDRKWNVNREALLSKLAGLTNFTSACLEIWACAYWEDTDVPVETYIRQMASAEVQHA